MNDIDNKVHLFSIRDNALDVYIYPLICTYDDLVNFLSARLECDYSGFPDFFKYPEQYSVFDCGTYSPIVADGSGNPFRNYVSPRFLKRVIDFRGDTDGKSASTDKNI